MRLLIPLILLAVTACAPVFKLSTRQGNVIDDEKLAQVSVGMTREQVHYLLGSPLVEDDFQPGRWDYVAYFRSGAGSEHSRTVSLYFDADNLQRIEDSKPPVPGATAAPEAKAAEAGAPSDIQASQQ